MLSFYSTMFVIYLLYESQATLYLFYSKEFNNAVLSKFFRYTIIIYPIYYNTEYPGHSYYWNKAIEHFHHYTWNFSYFVGHKVLIYSWESIKIIIFFNPFGDRKCYCNLRDKISLTGAFRYLISLNLLRIFYDDLLIVQTKTSFNTCTFECESTVKILTTLYPSVKIFFTEIVLKDSSANYFHKRSIQSSN